MNADSRPPVAIRITRPYASEDEYLEHELDTLTRTSITLIGAQPRPDGVVLRFEIVLPAGQVLLRGEGRVVGFKPNAHGGVGGVSLRFTRLDMRSKALIDRAAALREKRRPSLHPTTMSERPGAPGGSVAPPPASRIAHSGSSSLPPPRSLRPEPASPQTSSTPSIAVESVSSSVLESSPSVPALEDPPSSPALESLAPPPTRSFFSSLPPRASVVPAPARESLRAPAGSREARLFPPVGESMRPKAATVDREALLARLRARAQGIDLSAVTSALDKSRSG